MPITIDGSNGITQAGEFNSDSSFGFKNRIINGAMVIDQRNAGASVTPASSAYTLDRWQAVLNVASKFSVQQSSTTATGFSKSLVATSTSAYSIGASEYCLLQQSIEGFNIADFGWGTANAKTVTLSFQVRSSLTGTFGGVLANSNFSRCYPFTYTILSANTFESKTVTIAGDTTGTWNTDNTGGINVNFSLGSGSTVSGTAGAWAGTLYTSATGSTSVVGTNGATFYITGVQLEVGSTATSFDYRPYGTELALCQRYYYLLASGNSKQLAMGSYYGSSYILGAFHFPVSMRTPPALSYTNGTSYYIFYTSGSADPFDSFYITRSTETTTQLETTGSVSGTDGKGGTIATNNASAFVAFTAEL